MPLSLASAARLAGPVVRSMRPHQGVKNVFVLAPVVFSLKVFHDGAAVLRSAAAFALFCGAAGVVYLVNDVFDVHADRAHPVRRRRPVASGELPLGQAVRAATGLLGGVLVAAFALDHELALIVVGYLTLNLLYSKVLKRIAFVDVVALALGFVLRVEAGGVAAEARVSDWLVLCTMLLAMFLGFGKRRHEHVTLDPGGPDRREVLDDYPLYLLDVALILTASATIVAYTLYTRDPHTAAAFGTDRLWWTAPCIATGIARFVWLVLRRRPESPTEQMLRDPPFLANVLVWGLLLLWLITPRGGG